MASRRFAKPVEFLALPCFLRCRARQVTVHGDHGEDGQHRRSEKRFRQYVGSLSWLCPSLLREQAYRARRRDLNSSLGDVPGQIDEWHDEPKRLGSPANRPIWWNLPFPQSDNHAREGEI